MTTPTKEQIKQAKLNLKNVKKVVIQVAALLAAARKGNALQNETDEFMFIVASTITEWEKIKDLDARVEKMCKNNPGIKDFEDFNKAINSPK